MGNDRRPVSWTQGARDCVDEILEPIAADSPRAAGKVLAVVLAAAESLSLFAERGRVVPEFQNRSIREIFVYRYRLIYQVSSTDVRVLALLHGAMDFERWLQRGDRPGRAHEAAQENRRRSPDVRVADTALRRTFDDVLERATSGTSVPSAGRGTSP